MQQSSNRTNTMNLLVKQRQVNSSHNCTLANVRLTIYMIINYNLRNVSKHMNITFHINFAMFDMASLLFIFCNPPYQSLLSRPIMEEAVRNKT